MDAPRDTTPDARDVLRKDRDANRSWLAKNLLGYVLKRTRDPDRARDVCQEAITRVLEGKGWNRWTYDGVDTPELSLLNHLCDVARAYLGDQRDRAAVRRELGGKDDIAERVADPEPAADAQMSAAEEEANDARLAALVMDRLDERTRAMLRLEEEGIDSAAVQAERLHCTVKDVYRMRERVAYHRDKVLEEERVKGTKP